MPETDIFQLIFLNKQDEVLSVIDSIDINQCNEWGQNLLHTAIAYNNTAIAEELIQRGIDVNRQNDDGGTPLHTAAAHNSLSLAGSIVAAGGDVNAFDKHGNSPLWTAVLSAKIGDYAIVELLLKHGADPHHKNNYGRSPIDFARQSDRSALLSLLEGTRPVPPENPIR